MIPTPSLNSMVIVAGLGAALLSATYLKAPQLSIALIAALGASAVVHNYRKRPGKVKFYRIHNTSGLVDQTADLLMKEWPNACGDVDILFNRKASLFKSSVNLPCHLIAVLETTAGREVVAHAVLPPMAVGLPDTYKKFAKMVKVGVPLDSAKKAARLAGLDPDLLDNIPAIDAQEDDTPPSNTQAGALSFVVVKPQYRGYGIGKGICGYAIQTAKELDIQMLVIYSCPDNVLPFFQKVGFWKEKGKRVEGVPKVRLHNHLILEINDRVVRSAQEKVRMVSQ